MAGQAQILTSKEIQALFRVLATSRNRALFATGIYTALRIGEIVAIEYSQVFTEDGIRNVLATLRSKKKQKVYSNIPIHSNLKIKLAEYRLELDPFYNKILELNQKPKYLFPGRYDEHLNRKSGQNILRDAFDTLGLTEAKTHSMRRTALTNLHRMGVPIKTIKEISGHEHIDELQAYIEVTENEVQRAIKALKY